MKALVVTDTRGKITGLVRFEGGKVEGAPTEARIVPLEGQQIHEVELPLELERIQSVADVYAALEHNYAVDRKSAKLTKKTKLSRRE